MDVEVQSNFDGRWVPGFVVIAVEGPDHAPQVRLRRRSDASELPYPVPAARVRPTGIDRGGYSWTSSINVP